MTATFGRLDNETLTLTPGLNVITAPNEAGKSTWAAFLMAMFYGIDTKERATKGVLPAKTKYKPWSGKPMQGVVELTWNGRNITLQRQSEGRAPMGKLTAYDTVSGEPLPFLTAENCGKTLLGIERGVFARSAFIGQNAMSVTQDPGLEQKLSSLVTTGDETVSFTKTYDSLNTWKNHVRHNKTGYLPETEAQLSSVEEKLRTIHESHKADLSLHVRKQELTEQKEKLLYIEKNLRAAQALEKQNQLLTAEETLHAAEAAHAAASEAVSSLPAPEELAKLQKDMDALTILQELAAKAEMPALPVQPEIPELFRGLTPEQAKEKAEAEAAEIRRLQAEQKPFPCWILGAVLLLFCAALTFFQVVSAAVLAVGAAALAMCILRDQAVKKKIAESRKKATELLVRYGADSPDALAFQAARYSESLRQYEDAKVAYTARLEAVDAERAKLQNDEAAILTAVRAFAANIYTIDDAQKAIADAMAAHQTAKAAESALRNAIATREAIKAAVGDCSVPQAPTEDFSDRYSLPQVTRAISLAEQELHSIETALAQHQGLVQSLGDPAALEAEKQQLAAHKANLEQRNAALTLAMEALSQANAGLRSRFSPQISQAAGAILSRMTSRRYDGLRMEQDLTLHAKQSDEAVTRELLQLSDGTADQLYLALRLAICDLALEEGTPLVLDDALVFFDDTRLAQTMELLKEESEKRQILLFSCQSREAAYLAKGQ